MNMQIDSAGSAHKEQVSIIYEDGDVFAVNKPAGLVVHADGRTVESTLSDWVLEKYPILKDVGVQRVPSL